MIKKFFSARKGFTIVELTIVIAVIAILAAVLIPTFVSLVKKANNSADVQMVTNINKYLAAMEATDGKNVTMADAVKDAEDAGYKAAILTASNPDNTILWDKKNDRFLVVDGQKIVAGLDEKKISDNNANYWIVSALVDETYSTYYIGSVENEIKISDPLGFDVGDRVVTVDYSGATNDVILNGVFNKLTISGTGKPTVYGYVYQLSGNVNADGAVFHNDDRSNVTATGNSVTFGICYDADKDEKCDFCKEDMCKHIWNVEVIQTAGCERIGLTKSTCTNNGCNKEKYEVEPELGHDWKELEPIEPTCTTAGQTSGWVCLRCEQKKDGGDIIYPLQHAFGEDGRCTRPGCNMTLIEYLEQATRITQDDILNGTVDLKGKDKRMEVITVVLDSDVEISADKFCELFGTPEYAYWLEKNGDDVETGDSEQMVIEACYGNGIYALDLILNGYELKINGDSIEAGIGIYGNLRVWGRENDKSASENKNGLILHGNSYVWTSLLYASQRGTAVTFDSIKVTSTYAPVYMSYLGTVEDADGIKLTSQTLTIQNSSLKFEDIVAESTLGQKIQIYFTAEAVDGKSVFKTATSTDLFHNSVMGCFRSYNNGVAEAYNTANRVVKFYISFYMYDADGNKVSLPNDINFFDNNIYGWAYPDLTGEEMYAVNYGCKRDIKDKDDNSITVRTTGSGEWYKMNDRYAGDDYKDYVKIDSDSEYGA